MTPLELADADREVLIVMVGELWRNQIYAGSFDGDERLKTIARHREQAFLAGIQAGLNAGARAFRSAQYDPAPYTRGMSALKKLDPADIALRAGRQG